ncbi:MAG: trimeric intracellular cation channel family protein, partial [Geminicoccaceae bacterium]|nr:trimeric intracellular cation channel family protein [Geminicoccaceae bacterium]
MLLLPFWLDAAGVFVFAVSGALTASRKELDILGFVFIGSVTGIGGGTVRDLLLGRIPVFWVGQPDYLLVTVAASVLVYFTAHLVERRYKLLLWADALGLALFSVLGARIALLAGTGPLVAIVMGVMTAAMGGLI